MSNYGNYFNGCKEVINDVSLLVKQNKASLSEKDYFDYLFKLAFVYRTDVRLFVKEENYRIALFYQKVLKLIKNIEGKELKPSLIEFSFKKINAWSLLCLGYSADNVILVKKGKTFVVEVDEHDECFVLFRIKNKESFIENLLDFAEYSVEETVNCEEYVVDYLRNVYSDIQNGVVPVVYDSVIESRTTSVESVKTPNTEKVIYLENLGGFANGRYERGVI